MGKRENIEKITDEGEKWSYVVEGAILKCSCGSSTCTLQIPGRKAAKIQGRLQANITDFKPMANIPPFGYCTTRNSACMPGIAMPWINGKKDTWVDGAPALQNISKVMCLTGGKIEIVHDGQGPTLTRAGKPKNLFDSMDWDRMGFGFGNYLDSLMMIFVGTGAVLTGATIIAASAPAIIVAGAVGLVAAGGTFGMMGISNAVEGQHDVVLGAFGSESEAVNPVKDTVFYGNNEAYYNTQMIAGGIVIAGEAFLAPWAAAASFGAMKTGQGLGDKRSGNQPPRINLGHRPRGKNVTGAVRVKSGSLDPVREVKFAGNAGTRPVMAGVSKGAGKWNSPDGTIKWPTNYGFEGTPATKTLKPGTIVDRYGGETGKFVSPQGTPYANRSLPPGSDLRPYNSYKVVKPIDVQSGEIAPWFDQPGGGTQYQFALSIEDLIQSGYLRRLP